MGKINCRCPQRLQIVLLSDSREGKQIVDLKYLSRVATISEYQNPFWKGYPENGGTLSKLGFDVGGSVTNPFLPIIGRKHVSKNTP